MFSSMRSLFRYKQNVNTLFHFNKRFLGTGAVYQQDSNKVKLRGKFLRSRNTDMPTMLWFPEALDSVESWESWFQKSDNNILNYRNIWIVNSRNFGDSDHHDSFDLEEVSNDVLRFIDEKQLSIVTVGGHGYGAKIASAFGSFNIERTSGVICMEGGPIDHSYHEAWEEVKNAIIFLSSVDMATINQNELYRRIDAAIENHKWRAILKQNVVPGKGNLDWKFNMERLAANVKKDHRCDITRWNERFGLYPGRALVMFAEQSHWIFLATNTIPFYKFFPKLEKSYPSMDMNYIQGDEDKQNHWMHEYPKDQQFTVSNRITRWLKWKDGVHSLLADRSEVGWYAVPEREYFLTPAAAEYVPEHVHHNYKHTDAYTISKQSRGKIAASMGETKGVWTENY